MIGSIQKWIVFLGVISLTGCAQSPKLNYHADFQQSNPQLGLAGLIVDYMMQEPKKDFSLYKQAKPASILVVPVINESVDVDAPNYFLSTITPPLAEKGYYVFPVNTVKTVLEGEGLYDANLVHSADPTKIGKMFGADAILYVTINQWDAKYIVLATSVTVSFSYRIVSGKTGEELWAANKTLNYTPQSGSSGNGLVDLIAMAADAAVTRAAPNYIPMTRRANYQVFYKDSTELPNGPYLQPET